MAMAVRLRSYFPLKAPACVAEAIPESVNHSCSPIDRSGRIDALRRGEGPRWRSIQLLENFDRYGGLSTGKIYKILAARSANSERSPFCNSMCAAMASARNRLTT